MKSLFLVASYTFKDLVKRKSFIVSNIIILLFVIVGLNIPNIINTIQGDNEDLGKTKIMIIDNDNLYQGTLNSLVEQETGYSITVAEEKLTQEQIKEKIENEEMEIIQIEKGENSIIINYLVETVGMTTIMPDSLIMMLENLYKNVQISNLGISQEDLETINLPFEVELNQVGDQEATGNILAIMLLSMVLFYAIYFYAYQVAASITTEKTSKIIETLVTSTSPRTIVLGKTIGIGLAGVMQTIVTVLVAVICAKICLTPEMVNSVLDLSNITPTLGIITVIYYILGYALYALLYALTGSTVSKPEDVQSANGPVAMLAVVGFYLSYFTMMNPGSSLNQFAAIFPVSAPFCMPFRAMMGLATTSDLLISIGILLVTILIVAKVSIKIYSSAILNYGTRLNLKDILKLYKNKDN